MLKWWDYWKMVDRGWKMEDRGSGMEGRRSGIEDLWNLLRICEVAKLRSCEVARLRNAIFNSILPHGEKTKKWGNLRICETLKYLDLWKLLRGWRMDWIELNGRWSMGMRKFEIRDSRFEIAGKWWIWAEVWNIEIFGFVEIVESMGDGRCSMGDGPEWIFNDLALIWRLLGKCAVPDGRSWRQNQQNPIQNHWFLQKSQKSESNHWFLQKS